MSIRSNRYRVYRQRYGTVDSVPTARRQGEAAERQGFRRGHKPMRDHHAQSDLGRLRALPKAEVHVPLEGCFEPMVLEHWATQAGVPMPRPRERLLQFAGLTDFLEFLDWACGLASTQERVAELSYGFSRRLAASGAGYADILVSPIHWSVWHGRLRDLIDAIDAGLPAAGRAGLPPVGLGIGLARTPAAAA